MAPNRPEFVSILRLGLRTLTLSALVVGLITSQNQKVKKCKCNFGQIISNTIQEYNHDGGSSASVPS